MVTLSWHTLQLEEFCASWWRYLDTHCSSNNFAPHHDAILTFRACKGFCASWCRHLDPTAAGSQWYIFDTDISTTKLIDIGMPLFYRCVQTGPHHWHARKRRMFRIISHKNPPTFISNALFKSFIFINHVYIFRYWSLNLSLSERCSDRDASLTYDETQCSEYFSKGTLWI